MKSATLNHTHLNQGRLLALLLFTALTLFAFIPQTIAQTYKAVAGTELKVKGTSNMHDWVMQAQSVPAEAQLTFKDGQLQDISSFTLALPVKNLKAKEDLMNTRAYKAMKADKFDKITLKLGSATVSPVSKGQYNVKATGVLTIAGKAKEVQLQGKAVEAADGSITLTGTRKLAMSEYGITPPSFMLGALKVGNEVTIDYALKLRK